MSGEAESLRKQLKIRDRINKRRPRFVQVESWRYVRIPQTWRRPRGLDDKVRRCMKGWPASPGIGYGSPRSVRGIHPSGRAEVLVHNIGDLSIIDPDKQAARIGATVGERKRTAIVEEALKRGIRVLNLGKSRALAEIKETEEAEKIAEEKGTETGARAEAEGEAAGSEEEEEAK